MKKFVFPVNKSVNDFRLMGGIRGDDAIEPGPEGAAAPAPPTCFAAAVAATGIFADADADADALRRRLRFFLDIYGNNK